MPTSGEHHPAFEEYCECIFELDEDDVAVIQARIADRLQVSRPAVSEMIRRLEAESLIQVVAGQITLTDDGLVLAQQVVRRHVSLQTEPVEQLRLIHLALTHHRPAPAT